MLPDFLMVGTQRGGTTSLFRALAAHPAVVQPNFHKGVHFFDVNYPRGLGWYRGTSPSGRSPRGARTGPLRRRSSPPATTCTTRSRRSGSRGTCPA